MYNDINICNNVLAIFTQVIFNVVDFVLCTVKLVTVDTSIINIPKSINFPMYVNCIKLIKATF